MDPRAGSVSSRPAFRVSPWVGCKTARVRGRFRDPRLCCASTSGAVAPDSSETARQNALADANLASDGLQKELARTADHRQLDHAGRPARPALLAMAQSFINT
jgi:hypothetical protein